MTTTASSTPAAIECQRLHHARIARVPSPPIVCLNLDSWVEGNRASLGPLYWYEGGA